jgi:2C-methyl-D-erythritol 2,4-cyclodiphosphate synthase
VSRYRIKHGIAWGDDLTTTLEEVIKHINEDGYKVINIDMTVVCQEPGLAR